MVIEKRFKRCPTPIGHYTKQDGSVHAAACNNWKCPYCGQIKKKRVLDRVAHGFRHHGEVYGVTLTEVTETEKDIMKHWKQFKSRLDYVYGHLKYFWVKEFQLNGNRHLHILFEIPIPHKLIKEIWTGVTGGKAYIVWINSYPITKSAGYLAKYLTKNMKDERFNRKERRYSFSQDDGFILDTYEAFMKYGFVPPKKGEYRFTLGAPPKQMADYMEKANYKTEIYDQTENWIYLKLHKQKVVMYCNREWLELNKSWYPMYDWVCR